MYFVAIFDLKIASNVILNSLFILSKRTVQEIV